MRRRCVIAVQAIGCGSRFLPPPEADRFHLHRWEVLSSGGHRSINLDVERFDGVRLCVRMDSAAVTTSTGTECRSSLVDLTEQRRAERRLAERERELCAMLEALADGVLRCDHGCVSWASDGAASLVDCSRSELLGRKFEDLLSELAAHRAQIEVSMAHGSAG